jgi:hypothetical protein
VQQTAIEHKGCSTSWSVRSFGNHRQITDLAFEMKVKNKYSALAPLDLES